MPGVLTRYTTAATLVRLADEGSRVALLLHVLAVGRGAAFGGLLVAASRRARRCSSDPSPPDRAALAHP